MNGNWRSLGLGMVIFFYALAPSRGDGPLCTTWDHRTDLGPTARNNHAMAFDDARARTVLFGGFHLGTYIRETWEWDGTSWAQVSLVGPVARASHAMAHDSARGVTILFGGSNASGSRSDTFEWNGSTWVLRNVPGPSARANHSMAFDAARGVTVLFGGGPSSTPFNDTWEWNGANWTNRAVSGPAATTMHAMAYDSVRGRTVLFGGWDGSGYSQDTWEWDGSSWTQVSTTGPSARGNHIMTYDNDRATVVMFGGSDGISDLGDTWQWDGSSWEQVSSSGPSPRSGHAGSYDSSRQLTVLFGGLRLSIPSDASDTWEYPDCDADDDSILDDTDNCPTNSNTGQEDADGDDVGDACDNCTLPNPAQADCQPNGIGDVCEIASCGGDPECADCNANGVPDQCEPDCNNNNVADECDIAGASDDCDGNTVPDECDMARGRVAMAVDFESGLPPGWTTTGNFGVTDQCRVEPTCNGDKWAYAGNATTCRYGNNEMGRLESPPITIEAGSSQLHYCSALHSEIDFDFAQVFANHDLLFEESGLHDVWEERVIDLSDYAGQTITITFHFFSDPAGSGTLGWEVDNIEVVTGTADCNGNTIIDVCDITGAVDTDCNANNKPDGCEQDTDCNGNGSQDICDISSGASEDCDGNLMPDSCSGDADLDGLMDVCDNCPDTANPGQEDVDYDGVGDVCDACNLAELSWEQMDSNGPGGGRIGHVMAFDMARGVTVLFGGSDGTNLRGDTWTWDGTSWTLSASSGPTPRRDADMVYDSQRNVMVLFGGINESLLADTWEWDGTTWTERMPGNSPEPRSSHAMAYDSARGMTVLFGGSNGPNWDTWEWDGSTWTRRNRFVGPERIWAHAMAYDARRGVTVLHGGLTPFGPIVALSNDTWEWDGIDWTLVSTSGPGFDDFRAEHAMAYDAGRGVVILWGDTFDSQVWQWDGAVWAPQAQDPPMPTLREELRLAYDSVRGRTVSFGGAFQFNPPLTDTWEIVSDCQGLAPPPVLPDPTGIDKTRFVTFSVPAAATAAGSETALRIRLTSLHHVNPPYTGGPSVPFSSFEGQVRWVGPPTQYVESGASAIPFYASRLQCDPYYQDWSTVGLLHVTGSAITPSSTYGVENVAASCQGSEASCAAVSAPLSIVTTRWGDVRSPYNPPDPSVQPDISDVSSLVDKFRNAPGAPIKARGLLAGAPGNPFGEITHEVLNVDFGFSHISACVDAFRGSPYPYTIAACP